MHTLPKGPGPPGKRRSRGARPQSGPPGPRAAIALSRGRGGEGGARTAPRVPGPLPPAPPAALALPAVQGRVRHGGERRPPHATPAFKRNSTGGHRCVNEDKSRWKRGTSKTLWKRRQGKYSGKGLRPPVKEVLLTTSMLSSIN